ncbi:MAG TPA: metallophosphoesterase [Longimicrobiales bacterium]|nr:metallophosphoesterase [Longimicrobiales bacterium]
MNRRTRTALVTAGLIAAPAITGTAHAQRSGLAGEGGLHVRLEGDTVRVAWIIAEPGHGFLQVHSEGRVQLDTTTSADSAHSVAFPRNGDRPLTLRYGSLERTEDRHQTVIDPRTGQRRPAVDIEGADTIIVIGDTHGEYDTLTHVLGAAGLLDDQLRWSGGGAHLVVLGDVTDRGAGATRSLWLLYRLEREAADAGGRVHLVLGNHELMVMLGDLRYVAPQEMAIAQLHGIRYDRLFDPRYSLLGRWLASRPALIRIDDVLFTHGGISPAYATQSLEAIDDSLAAFAGEELFYRWADTTYVAPLDSAGLARRNDFFWDASSLFWYRDLAQTDSLAVQMDDLLDHFDSRMLVVGHTPGSTIRQAYDGRLVLTNTYPFGREVLVLTRSQDGWAMARIGTDGVRTAVPASTPE